jgi:large subunit ribosomal protein L18
MATKQERYQFRKERTQRKLFAAGIEKPRLSVYRSLQYLYASIIDDVNGKIVVSATTSSKELDGKYKASGKSIEAATALGELIAKKAIEKGISAVRFDRGARVYHGRVKALAEAARKAGLKF